MPNNPNDPQETNDSHNTAEAASAEASEPNSQENGSGSESETFSISGTVYRYETMARMKYTVLTVTAKPEDGQEQPGPSDEVSADNDGDYKFEGLAEGEWIVEAFHPKNQFSKKRTVDLKKSRKDIDIMMSPLSSDADKANGWKFLYGSIGALLLLTLTYVILHLTLPANHGPLDEQMPKTLKSVKALVQKVAAKNDSLQLGPTLDKMGLAVQKLPKSDSLKKRYLTPLNNKFQAGDIDSVETILASMVKDTLFKPASKLLSRLVKDVSNFVQLKGDTALTGPITRIETVLKPLLKTNESLKPAFRDSLAALPALILKSQAKNNSIAMLSQLEALDKGIKKPALKKGFSPWTEYPLLMLEVLMWAFAGILAHKIIIAGSYLRFNRFYTRGIPMHLSHYFAVPLMVLVTMMLLSLVSFEFSLEQGKPVKIDLKNAYILAAFSFVLANQPWAIRRFIRTSGLSLTNTINRNKNTENEGGGIQ